MEIQLECIEFTKDEIPVSKKVDINGTLFTVEVQYNEIGNFYTALVYNDENRLLITSKLVNMGNVFHAKIPGLPRSLCKKLIPLHLADLGSDVPLNIRVDKENFGERIKLYLV